MVYSLVKSRKQDTPIKNTFFRLGTRTVLVADLKDEVVAGMDDMSSEGLLLDPLRRVFLS